jgi:hypothetical protein
MRGARHRPNLVQVGACPAFGRPDIFYNGQGKRIAMSLEDNALTQTRQLMASQLPEYRPFALQEIVRAATFQGGDVASLKRPHTHVPTTYNPLNMPAWLDISLYCVAAFVIATAIFMGMYASLVRPYQIEAGDEDEVFGVAHNIGRQSMPLSWAPVDAKSRGGPPHPPPPMLPATRQRSNLPLPTP